ncbi:putative endoribonuclease EndoU [Helianthus debilis subsp. tardiflorus]
MDYLFSNWLQPYADLFVAYWTDQHLNFGQCTTNRVEGQHALFKRYLCEPNLTLDKVVLFIDQLMKNQVTKIKASIEASRSRTMDHITNLFLISFERRFHINAWTC